MGHRIKTHVTKYKIYWYLCQYSGLRYVWCMIDTPIDPDTGRKKPSNFLLWTIGIYVALFGIAFQRYENRINRLEAARNTLIEQLGGSNNSQILTSLADMQLSLAPKEPNIFNPYRTVRSFYLYDTYPDLVRSIETTISNSNKDLSFVKLNKTKLSALNLLEGCKNLEIENSIIDSLRFGTGLSKGNEQHISIGKKRTEDNLAISKLIFNKSKSHKWIMKKSRIKYSNIIQSSIDTLHINETLSKYDYFKEIEIKHLNIDGSVFNSSTFLKLKVDSITNSSTRIRQGKQYTIMPKKVNIFYNCFFDSVSLKNLLRLNNSIFIGCRLKYGNEEALGYSVKYLNHGRTWARLQIINDNNYKIDFIQNELVRRLGALSLNEFKEYTEIDK